MSSRAQRLLELGQSVWLDFIRRGHMVSGEFDRLVREAGVVGVTSNPTIFQLAIAESADYDDALAARIAEGLSGPALFEALAVEDIQMACDRLRGVWERTGGRDGRVSIEVSPKLAADTAGTIAEARRLHRSVGRGNLFVKVPATVEGLPAISTLIAEGISINVTLIFSLARYRQVMDAYLSGLERRAAQGATLAEVFSVASFFVSRVDSITCALRGTPMLPPTSTRLPAAVSMRPTSVVVVDFPFVPVMATTGPLTHRHASSSSPTISIPRERAASKTGCSSGTPGLATIRSASASVAPSSKAGS